jgi:hypothetical protein
MAVESNLLSSAIGAIVGGGVTYLTLYQLENIKSEKMRIINKNRIKMNFYCFIYEKIFELRELGLLETGDKLCFCDKETQKDYFTKNNNTEIVIKLIDTNSKFLDGLGEQDILELSDIHNSIYDIMQKIGDPRFLKPSNSSTCFNVHEYWKQEYFKDVSKLLNVIYEYVNKINPLGEEMKSIGKYMEMLKQYFVAQEKKVQEQEKQDQKAQEQEQKEQKNI